MGNYSSENSPVRASYAYPMEIFALEFFSGIGGLHCALKEATQALKIPAKVLASFDVNPNANAIYATNFPDVKLLNKVSECASRKHDFIVLLGLT